MCRFAGRWRRLPGLAARLLGLVMIGLVTAYQFTLSPLLGPRCRYWPSCSRYTVEAIRVHGPFKGGWLAVRRIVRCHPGSAGGIDPVPGGPSEQLCREDDELDENFHCRRHDGHHQR
ncbi:membrane protein insertion efficiency factor YidD [Halomonas kalidii]